MARPKTATFERDGYILHRGYRIRKRETQSGESYVVHCGRVGGKRLRKQFKTRRAAERYAEDLEI